MTLVDADSGVRLSGDPDRAVVTEGRGVAEADDDQSADDGYHGSKSRHRARWTHRGQKPIERHQQQRVGAHERRRV